ncbi:MAG: hypothetical protein ACI8RA_001737 [Chlamydiales bacterium]|jgi:hypothetical protein
MFRSSFFPIPEKYICAISSDIMVHPINLGCEGGHTCDYVSLSELLASKVKTCPKDGSKIDLGKITYDSKMREDIRRYAKANPEKLGRQEAYFLKDRTILDINIVQVVLEILVGNRDAYDYSERHFECPINLSVMEHPMNLGCHSFHNVSLDAFQILVDRDVRKCPLGRLPISLKEATLNKHLRERICQYKESYPENFDKRTHEWTLPTENAALSPILIERGRKSWFKRLRSTCA